MSTTLRNRFEEFAVREVAISPRTFPALVFFMNHPDRTAIPFAGAIK